MLPNAFQLEDLNRRARAALAEDSPSPRWETMPELERRADEAVRSLRALRARLARPGHERFRAWLERRVDTDTVEYMDRAEHPPAEKLGEVRWLHRQNIALRSYQRYLALLRPWVDDVRRARPDRPVRLLELACGSGELTMALAERAARLGLPVEITGSDVVPAYVADARRRAGARGVPAQFRELNAFDLSTLRPGEYDLVFIVQSIHHFSPGQLAMMIAQVGASGARHFVGVDGRRSLALLAFLPGIAALTLNRYFTHDAWVSARRMYAEAELDLIASIAAPGARVSVCPSEPGLSVLHVVYPGDDARAVGA